MPIDPYALCPCGSGKKLKFCCADLMGEMEKIQRMIDGDQPAACLTHIKQLAAQYPNRPSLMGLQATLEMELDRLDDARQTIDEFVRQYPENPVAQAGLAMLRARLGEVDQAIEPLQNALETIERDMPRQVYEAIGAVGQALLGAGDIFAARAHLLLQAGIGGAEDRRAMSILARIYQAPQIPLLLKDDLNLAPPPPGATWEAPLVSALDDAAHGLWRRAAGKLEGLLGPSGDAPQIWRNLALVRGWLGDTAGSLAALRKYSTLDVGLDDAVEAQALAQLLDLEATGNQIDVVRIVYPVRDMDQLEAALAADRRSVRMPIDPASLDPELGPPPRRVVLVLDLPLPASGLELTIDQAPQVIGQAALYGRETDREPRLELVTQHNDYYELCKQTISQIAGAALGEPEPETVTSQISFTQDALGWNWRLPDDTPRKLRTELIEQKTRQVILDRWPNLKLPVLDNHTPAEAAQNPALRAAVLGAILLLEQASRVERSELDFNDLRRKLGLPTVEPIDPTGVDVASLPVIRLERLVAEKLSDDDLVGAFRRVSLLGADKALTKLGREMVGRTSLTGKIDRAELFGMLAELESDPDKALADIEQARQAAEAAKQSSAPWDLAELALQIERGDTEGAQRVLTHIRSAHLREEGVAERLYEILVSYGIVSPQGVPAGPVPAGAGMLSPAAAPGGGLWTPESAQPEAAQKSKLWVPGME